MVKRIYGYRTIPVTFEPEIEEWVLLDFSNPEESSEDHKDAKKADAVRKEGSEKSQTKKTRSK